MSVGAGSTVLPSRQQAAWVVEPYLHLGADRAYNPLTDRTLHRGTPQHGALLAVLSAGATPASLPPHLRQELIADGWLVAEGRELARRFLLKYVSLETHTVCNQSCYFCPVSVRPRDAYFMPTELFQSIVDQLAPFRSTLHGVFLMSYNEPTLDRRFVEQCRTVLVAGLPAAVNSNATGLTPEKVDALVACGPLRYLSINLSTLDRERYLRERGQDQLPLVLRNLDYAKDRPVAQQMVVMVLGEGDERHEKTLEEARRRFAGSRFEVESGRLMDRAGYLEIGLKATHRDRRLCGCENVGSRPLQHLHVTPQGRCVLCCEDYDGSYEVGDLSRQTVLEVLTSDRFAELRRWAYGIEDAPAGFLCRSCIFARTR